MAAMGSKQRAARVAKVLAVFKPVRPLSKPQGKDQPPRDDGKEEVPSRDGAVDALGAASSAPTLLSTNCGTPRRATTLSPRETLQNFSGLISGF